jgi:hypothetical protein
MRRPAQTLRFRSTTRAIPNDSPLIRKFSPVFFVSTTNALVSGLRQLKSRVDSHWAAGVLSPVAGAPARDGRVLIFGDSMSARVLSPLPGRAIMGHYFPTAASAPADLPWARSFWPLPGWNQCKFHVQDIFSARIK